MVLGTFVRNLTFNNMIYKNLITLAYAAPAAYLFYKLVKGGFFIKGNETIVLLLPPLLALLPPGDDAACFARLCFASTPLLFWIYLNTVNSHVEFRKFYHLYIVILVMLLVEYAIVHLKLGGNTIFIFYSSLYLVAMIIFNIWLAFARKGSKELNNMLSVRRLYDILLWVSTVMLLSAGAMVLITLSNCRGVPQVAMTLLLGCELGYVFHNSPQCFKKKVVQSVVDRKRAYVMGKSVKSGHILQDEGYGIVSEDVIDDARLISSLMELFEREKLYRNPDVKIGNVAIMLGTNKTYLSRALNTRVGKNFCQFVNFYRVREICQLYLEDMSRDIRKISESSGFSSPSNFSIVFKYSTGFSPCDWCKVVKSKIEANEQVSVDDFVV